MQTVEQFLREYFRNRTELFRESARAQASHTQQFFAPGYELYDRRHGVKQSEKESIISVGNSDGLAEVITTGIRGWRFRYRVAVIGVTWRIKSIEMECEFCRFWKAERCKDDCKPCKGAGWRLLGDRARESDGFATDSQIDDAVIAFLATANGRWRKVSMVIMRAMKALKANLPDGKAGEALITKRLETLVDDGRLDERGDVSEWRECHSEVRLPL